MPKRYPFCDFHTLAGPWPVTPNLPLADEPFGNDMPCGPDLPDTICIDVPECTSSGDELSSQPPPGPDRCLAHFDDPLIRGEFELAFDAST